LADAVSDVVEGEATALTTWECEEDVLTASVRALSLFPNLGLTWADLAWLRDRTPLPILVKGEKKGRENQAVIRSSW